MNKICIRRLISCSLNFFLTLSLAVSLASAGEAKPVRPSSKDKCGVCGMFVAKYPEWIAEIIFKDGSYAVFDGPKDMLIYYHNLGKYNSAKKTADISAIFVTEYYSTNIVPAEKVFFITGSDVNGPMGEEFIPVEKEANAKEFMKDHKGQKMLRFDEITKETLK